MRKIAIANGLLLVLIHSFLYFGFDRQRWPYGIRLHMPFASVIRWWLRRAQREIHMKCVLRQDVISHFRWIRFSHHDVFVCPSAITFYSLCPFVRCFERLHPRMKCWKHRATVWWQTVVSVTPPSPLHCNNRDEKKEMLHSQPILFFAFRTMETCHVRQLFCIRWIYYVRVSMEAHECSLNSQHTWSNEEHIIAFSLGPRHRWSRGHGTFISNWSD